MDSEPERKKKLIVVGDRVLIAPEEGEDRSRVGLYLPASAVDNQAVQGGKVVATGPGTPISAPTELDEEPWKIRSGEARFLRRVRDGACDLFSTVLSPDYNSAHADHFHLDQAERGASGWRLCR